MLAADGHEVLVVDRDDGPVPAGPDEAWDRRASANTASPTACCHGGHVLMGRNFHTSSSGCETTAGSRSTWPTRSSISSPDRPIDPTTTASARSQPAVRRLDRLWRTRWPMSRRSRCARRIRGSWRSPSTPRRRRRSPLVRRDGAQRPASPRRDGGGRTRRTLRPGGPAAIAMALARAKSVDEDLARWFAELLSCLTTPKSCSVGPVCSPVRSMPEPDQPPMPGLDRAELLALVA